MPQVKKSAKLLEMLNLGSCIPQYSYSETMLPQVCWFEEE